MVQKVAWRSLIQGWAFNDWKTLCQPSSKLVPFLNQERIRQQKERDGLCLSSAVPKSSYSATLTPTASMAVRLRKTFTIIHYILSNNFASHMTLHQFTPQVMFSVGKIYPCSSTQLAYICLISMSFTELNLQVLCLSKKLEVSSLQSQKTLKCDKTDSVSVSGLWFDICYAWIWISA